jgi:hypothetical protein
VVLRISSPDALSVKELRSRISKLKDFGYSPKVLPYLTIEINVIDEISIMDFIAKLEGIQISYRDVKFCGLYN